MSVMDGWRTTTWPDIQRTATAPINDLVHHEMFSKNCVCGPGIIDLGNGWLQIAHNSLDGRELSEP